MKKYKLLHFGHCYINRQGDFIIALLSGDKKRGYTFAASHANPTAFLGKIHSLSRTVPNDGSWIEIDKGTFNIAAECHITGHVVQIPEVTGKELPIISRKYGSM